MPSTRNMNMVSILKISLMNYVRSMKSNTVMHTQQTAIQYDEGKKHECLN